MLAGIVETVPGYYSGGVENLPRFLENWSGRGFTYNGSMIVLLRSQYGTAPCPGTGTICNQPNRNWNFDVNFLNLDRLPPLCPSVRAVIRGQYALIRPGTWSAAFKRGGVRPHPAAAVWNGSLGSQSASSAPVSLSRLELGAGR